MTNVSLIPVHQMFALSLAPPEPRELAALSAAAGLSPFTYGEVAGTRGPVAGDWNQDVRTRVLGQGEAVFERAREALFDWSILGKVPWLRLGPTPPPAANLGVTFSARVYGLWTTQSCRIVYADTERGADLWLAAWAWGTVGPHPLNGEERFEVRWDRSSDQVRAEIRKFSLPAHPLVTVVSPIVRHLQQQFSVAVLDALQAHIEQQSPTES